MEPKADIISVRLINILCKLQHHLREDVIAARLGKAASNLSLLRAAYIQESPIISKEQYIDELMDLIRDIERSIDDLKNLQVRGIKTHR